MFLLCHHRALGDGLPNPGATEQLGKVAVSDAPTPAGTEERRKKLQSFAEAAAHMEVDPPQILETPTTPLAGEDLDIPRSRVVGSRTMKLRIMLCRL